MTSPLDRKCLRKKETFTVRVVIYILYLFVIHECVMKINVIDQVLNNDISVKIRSYRRH